MSGMESARAHPRLSLLYALFGIGLSRCSKMIVSEMRWQLSQDSGFQVLVCEVYDNTHDCAWAMISMDPCEDSRQLRDR